MYMSPLNPRTYRHNLTPTLLREGGEGGGEPWTLTLRYFEKFLTYIDSLSCRLQDDVEIMRYICKCHCRGGERVVTPFNMVHVFRFLTFPL